MMKKIRKFAAIVLTLCVLASLAAPALAASGVQSELQGSAAYMLSAVKAPEVGSIGGEWAVIGLARSGYPVPANYFDDYYARVEKYVKDCAGVLHERKYTEYSRVILALTAIGRDPANVAGYNLLTPLGDFEKTIWQGLNGPIWALIALDSGSYDIPKNPAAKTQATRQLYINEILNNQLADGGWNLTGTGNSDPDMTAMALQALAKYQDQKSVQSATDKALTWLSKVQDSKGGYASWGTTNVESVAQVAVALCELGISLDDSRFVKNGHTLTENLLSFRQSNGGFYHVLDGSDGNNQMSSEQGFYALVAIDRAENGKNSLYRMGDVTKNTSKPASNVSKGNADASVKVPGVTAPGTTFTDIKNHANKAAIEELASRGIINGMGKGTFLPNKTMTRAEFAAIVTRALGLAAKDTKAFTDVPSSKWYAGYIGTANSSGIVNGVGSGKFNPRRHHHPAGGCRDGGKSREALRPRYRHVRRRDQRHARPVRRLPRRSQLGQGAAGVLLRGGDPRPERPQYRTHQGHPALRDRADALQYADRCGADLT